jgi:membrane associated rhomboid family serine protease
MAYSQRRSGSFDFNTPPGVKSLIIFTVVCYLVHYVARLSGVLGSFFEHLYLTPQETIWSFKIWQPVTYIFLHAIDPFHILFNMLTLWFMGRDVEQVWGKQRFVQYYLMCGVGAALVVILVDLATGRNTSTYGASGAVCGVMMAFAMMFPDRELFFFPLPFAVKAKYFVAILAAVNLLMVLPGGSGVSYIAHVGGFLVGYLYFKVAYNARHFDPMAALRAQYRDWKMARAKRKFQVYMNKQRNRD